ncbi:MAG: hypothetical protein KIT31_14360 [Deltaproteobacteria bacterium]|nr:hypothetical protein [Deltaproteobacteria bacterium]
MTNEYEDVLRDVAGAVPTAIVLDAGLATSMKTHAFRAAYPNRYFNLGIAEQHAVSFASGLARRGFIPLLHSFSNFLARRAHDQIAISVCWPRCNVKLIAGSCGVFDGRNGPSHMATDDLAAMAALPNMVVVEPGDKRQLRGLLRRVLATNGPAYVRVRRFGAPENLLPDHPDDDGTHVFHRCDDARVTLVVGGSLLCEGLLAVKVLADRDIPVDAIHVAVLKPLDAEAILSSAVRSRLVVSVENHVASGGFSDAVARAIGGLGVRHARCTLPDTAIPAGDAAWQLAYCRLDGVSIADFVEEYVRKGQHV